VDEFNLPVSPKRIDHGIERIADDPVATLHASLFEHVPQKIRYISRHEVSPGGFGAFGIPITPDAQ
jgi:hypothetical protein